jgi:hypothetical protein
MRTTDRPTPPIVLDPHAFATRPVRPVIALAGLQEVAVWDDPALVYDAEGVAGSARVGVAMVGWAKVGQP